MKTYANLEAENAKVIFDKVFKIEEFQYDHYGVYDVEEGAEVYVCDKTLWHYLYFPESKKYWMIIDRCDQYFNDFNDLKDFASKYYFL